MSRRDLSLEFLDAFCNGEIDRLEALLAEDLRFEGPLLQSNHRAAYLERLHADPPGEASYEIRDLIESHESVALLYDYRTKSGTTLIAQWNRFRGRRISEIVLVFDARRF